MYEAHHILKYIIIRLDEANATLCNEDELGEPEVFAMFLDPRVKSRGGTMLGDQKYHWMTEMKMKHYDIFKKISNKKDNNHTATLEAPNHSVDESKLLFDDMLQAGSDIFFEEIEDEEEDIHVSEDDRMYADRLVDEWIHQKVDWFKVFQEQQCREPDEEELREIRSMYRSGTKITKSWNCLGLFKHIDILQWFKRHSHEVCVVIYSLGTNSI